MDNTQADLERTHVFTELTESFLFQRMAERNPDLLYVSEYVTGHLTYISPRSEQVIGYSAEQLQRLDNQALAMLWHPDDIARIVGHQQWQTLQDGEIYECEYRLRQPDGTYRWLRTRSCVFSRTDDGEVRQLIGSTQDITTYKQAEAERRLQVWGQLAHVQEAERLQLVRELHNSLGQSTCALLLNLHGVEGDLPPAVTDRLKQLQTLALHLSDEVERIAFTLRPWVLDELGLAAALHQLAKRWNEASGVPVDLDIQGLDSERLPISVETTLYRIVQEALTNIRNHASASAVRISVEQQPDEVFARIVDNGCGFDLEVLQDVGQVARQFGLTTMMERARVAGGRLTIESAPAAGTTLHVHIPLPTR